MGRRLSFRRNQGAMIFLGKRQRFAAFEDFQATLWRPSSAIPRSKTEWGMTSTDGQCCQISLFLYHVLSFVGLFLFSSSFLPPVCCGACLWEMGFFVRN